MKKINQNNTIFKILIVLTTIITSQAFSQEMTEVEKIPLEQMEKLTSILGEWETVHYEYTEEGNWNKTATSTTVFTKKLKGKLIEEEIRNLTPATGFIVETSITYDQYRSLYRLAAIDDTYGLMDIYEGNLEGKKFVVTNLRAGTHFPSGDGGNIHFRLTFEEINNDNREFLVERSSDEGETWIPMVKNILKRISS